MMQNVLTHHAYAAMREYRQFIVMRYEHSPNGKTKKVPIDWRTGATGNANNPALWLSAEEAYAVATRFGPGYGIGFVFTIDDPFFFIDIDHCLDNGACSELAKNVLAMFVGSAVEVSQSGRGLHIFSRYSGVVPDHQCRKITLGMELYTERRFVALTGNVL